MEQAAIFTHIEDVRVQDSQSNAESEQDKDAEKTEKTEKEKAEDEKSEKAAFRASLTSYCNRLATEPIHFGEPKIMAICDLLNIRVRLFNMNANGRQQPYDQDSRAPLIRLAITGSHFYLLATADDLTIKPIPNDVLASIDPRITAIHDILNNNKSKSIEEDKYLMTVIDRKVAEFISTSASNQQGRSFVLPFTLSSILSSPNEHLSLAIFVLIVIIVVVLLITAITLSC